MRPLRGFFVAMNHDPLFKDNITIWSYALSNSLTLADIPLDPPEGEPDLPGAYPRGERERAGVAVYPVLGDPEHGGGFLGGDDPDHAGPVERPTVCTRRSAHDDA